ncbi:orotidine-5'-phosphate decarboxylase [Kamptonema animale CS-326]|jgi:orotidine-5'-phosphate decarboxylase|uniref:orotidine-5'-phosphate decarboxylase n=1 Tax=Kamptonema animale TaxID=92934 RepID=UPI00232D29D1|nr:orotidine-5'-phosphate decarboxylase [Kamptonema animale]MDB9514047.1 orotidine-5'-phosphate decarboxylase [Kamptonema animale CS-326]
MQFSDRLVEKITQTSNIVVGIDPNFDLMPKAILPANGDSQAVTNALVNFAKLAIDTAYNLIPAVKFQSAYFEQFGSAGIKALAQSIEYARNQKLLVILDAKRGDIGSTSLAYAQAYLEGKTKLANGLTIESDLEVDCITINPFLGDDSLEPFVETAIKCNKGLFILVKTSNPGSQMIQDRVVNGKTISYYLAELVNQLGKDSIGKSGYSSIGAVVGATFPEQAKQLREIMPNAIFLVPGVGSQGGKIENTFINFNPDGQGAIVPISRGITYFSNLDMSLEEYQFSMRKKVEYFVEITKKSGN